MPDHPNTNDFDLDDILASVVIEPDEQFEQRLKMRLRKRLNDSNPQKLSSNGFHSPIRQVTSAVQENHPMTKSQMPAAKVGLGTRIKSLFVRPSDAPDTPRRTWAFSLLALGAMAAVVAIMAFVLGGRGSQQVIVGSGPAQEETSEPSHTPTTEPTATATLPDPTATERPTERPTERATHENRTPSEPTMTIEEASTVAGFTVLGFATVPDGYELVRRNAEANWAMTIYSLRDSEVGRQLWLTQSTPTALNDWLANEMFPERAVEVTVNGSPAFFLPQDDGQSGGHTYNQLGWNQGDFTFVLGALHFTQEEMIALAESLQ